MFNAISEKIVYDAIRRGYVKEEDVEDYTYGLSAFFNSIVNILSALLIGIITHMIVEISLFLIVFMTLRKYVGGSHSRTALRCYISTFFTYAVVLCFIKYGQFDDWIITAGVCISDVIMIILAPVEAEKKPLDSLERKVYGKRARIAVLFWTFIYILLNYTGIILKSSYYSYIITIAMVTVAVFCITGAARLATGKSNNSEKAL